MIEEMKLLMTASEKRRKARTKKILNVYNEWLSLPEEERPKRWLFYRELGAKLQVSDFTVYRTIKMYEATLEKERRGRDDN